VAIDPTACHRPWAGSKRSAEASDPSGPSPPATRTVPSASVVVVAWERAAPSSAPADQRPVVGSKSSTDVRAWSPGAPSVLADPPATSTRPSGSTATDAPERATASEPVAVQAPVAGSKISAEANGPSAPPPPATSTRPSGSVAMAALLRASRRAPVAVHTPGATSSASCGTGSGSMTIAVVVSRMGMSPAGFGPDGGARMDEPARRLDAGIRSSAGSGAAAIGSSEASGAATTRLSSPSAAGSALRAIDAVEATGAVPACLRSSASRRSCSILASMESADEAVSPPSQSIVMR
jgi:hypothetical protein